MKLTYLGTAAAEGFPAVFCNCKHCLDARKIGGKNIRTRSQAIINDDLLIDLPADTYHHFLMNNIEGDKIENLLITHSHGDHFYPKELELRSNGFAREMRVPTLSVFSGKGAHDVLTEYAFKNIEPNLIPLFEKVKVGKYNVISLPANHFKGDDARFYIIENDGKTILYAHDTGYFFPEVLEFIEKEEIKFDLISLDCTNIEIPIEDIHPHMGIPNIKRLIAKLTSIGAVNNDTIKVINHFSHNARPSHHELEEKVKDEGWLVSYDGFTIEI